jgi:hypothetical protein
MLLCCLVGQVRDDMTTDVMKRSISKRYVEEFRNPSLVISILLKDRTLDFEIEEVCVQSNIRMKQDTESFNQEK